MCLFTDNKEGLISKKAIKCYKLFEKGKEENTLISPIARTVHYCEEGKEIKAEGKEIVKLFKGPQGDVWAFERGFIHGYSEKYEVMTISTFLDLSCNMIRKLMEKEDVETMVENYLDTLLNEFKSLVVYKMEVPAGERYWLGYAKDICAKRMVLVKELKLNRKSDLLELIFQWHKEMCSADIRREKSEVWKRYKNLIQHYREIEKEKELEFKFSYES